MKQDRNEEKLQAILDGSNLATWQWNIQTGDTVYNERWAQIVGYTLEELEPVSIETWNRIIHPEDSKRSLELLEQHFAGALPFYDMEARMRHKNGSWVWIHDRGKVIEWTEDGKLLMMFGTHADITQRKIEEEESSRQLRFFQLSSDLMIIMDPEGKTWKANRSWHTMLGYDEDEICQIPQISLIHPDDIPITAETIAEFTSQAGSRHVSRIRHKDGSYRSIEWQIQSQEGWLYATGRDITERIRSKQQLDNHLRIREKHLDLLKQNDLSVPEFLDLALKDVISFTGSQLGYIFLYDEELEEFQLHSWSEAVMEECKVKDRSRLYYLGNVGLWGEVVRQRAPIIVNDYHAPHVHKKGYPEGHVMIRNFLSIPVYHEGKIMAVVGAANKDGDYDQEDVLLLNFLMNTVWSNVERIKAEELLRRERELLNTTLMSVGEGILVASRSGEILLVNAAAEKISGYSRTDLLHRNWNEVVHIVNIHTGERVDVLANNFLETGMPLHSMTDYALVTRDGSQVRLSANIGLIQEGNGQDARIVASFLDISKEYELEKQIEGFLDINLDLLCVADLDGNFHKINKRFQDALGYGDQELNGASFYALVHEDDLESTREAMENLASRKAINGFVNRFRCKDGSYRYLEWVSQPAVGNYIYASARDVTEKRLAEEELRETAITDELTGLFNRHYFETIIIDRIQKSDHSGEPLSMLLLDLDHFKQVNDTFGHPIGDELLRHVAQIMLRSIRETDILVRFGGEEFAILLPKTNLEGALAAAEKIRRAIEEQPLPAIGVRTASVGVAERFKSESFRHWYRRLDGALYLAKNMGRNRVEVSDGTEPLPLSASGLTWRRKWESGNEEIDSQHKELIAIGNRLLQLAENPEQLQELQTELDHLLRHTAFHFAQEDKILAQTAFPDLQNHRKEHADLLHKALELKKAYDQGEVQAVAFFSFLVDDVILDHLLEKDVTYYPYMRKK